VENFKQIDKCDVWPHLQAGKRVYAVVLGSKYFEVGIKFLYTEWDVRDINRILSDSEKNVLFYEEI
jgi:hypothetical protein